MDASRFWAHHLAGKDDMDQDDLLESITATHKRLIARLDTGSATAVAFDRDEARILWRYISDLESQVNTARSWFSAKLRHEASARDTAIRLGINVGAPPLTLNDLNGDAVLEAEVFVKMRDALLASLGGPLEGEAQL